MEQEDKTPGIKITTTGTNLVKEQIKSKNNKNNLSDVSAIVPRAGYYPQNECNPDNNDFFEERSNPLSSKGN
ncbi:hypothetical protein [Anaerocolumna sp. MB42-C2]|uniref:hypothetical protein n=1 Tax=Anaerocolumna sp. MB42-C2 TaxID=3070997 RepID=UPI0027DFC1A2|nr:hypothetical protein [Anaerocolumna sp. MB42-C2]WMJ87358.1 hypothetical protein RBU59_25520 [Anaerocolumna sp. MB42-C2]